MTYAQLLTGAKTGRWDGQQPPNQIEFDGFRYTSRANVLRFVQTAGLPEGVTPVQFSLSLAELAPLSASDFQSKINGLRVSA